MFDSRHFKLSLAGSNVGIRCDCDGAFVGSVASLKRADGDGTWFPRSRDQLNAELSSVFGVPIDVSSKSTALASVARALNEGDVSRAQMITLFMCLPESSSLAKDETLRFPEKMIGLIRSLHESGLLKVDWEPDEHPR